jgi:hypothetical protein
MNAPFALTAPKASKARVRRGGWSWGPVEGARLRVLSLGAGVQSTALALMAAHGEVGPMPDYALFADTGDESRDTLETLRWLQSGNVLPFPVKVIGRGDRLSDSFQRRTIQKGDEGAGHFVSAPFFTENGGRAQRQCTRHYKVDVLKAEQRVLAGLKPRQLAPRAVEVWIGFTTDEVVRAGAAFDRWCVNRFPLLEARMSRSDCEQWLRRHDYPVPVKSACTFCPYRSDYEWRQLRDRDPEGWAEALRVDYLIRNSPRMKHRAFLHRSLKPLADVDLATAEDDGQGNMLEVCEAGCGL